MIEVNKTPKVLVVGDLMIDHYLWGNTDRISPEAPVQVVDIYKETVVLGGAGNVVNNLKTLGTEVFVVSVVGKDENANELRNMLDDIEVKHYLIAEKDRQTTKKSRIIAAHQQVIRYDFESKNKISSKTEDKVLQYFSDIICDVDIVLLSDYGKGVLTKKLTHSLITKANQQNKRVLIDPKGTDYSKYSGAYLLTPNKKEATEATKIKIKDEKTLKSALTKLNSIVSVEIPMITLSEDGIAILVDGDVLTKPTVAKEVYDVTGAGDTVLASLGYSLALNKNIVEAIEFANLAAGVVVGKIGSATVTVGEIEDYKNYLHKSDVDSHIKTTDEIQKIVFRLKEQKKKIVFTNGCFDILHKGHVQYLNTAKSFGDVLILGLNSDDSVRRLKGLSRPINGESDRAYILASLESVDYVVVFTQDTPIELIRTIEPDILVKGADYQDQEIVGSEIAKEVKLVQFVDGKSTTSTINKIRSERC